jgi:hypothetical protein
VKLLDEIIDTATENKESISVLLRKCLVLSYQLKNDRLKEWVDKELNGYDHDDELPKYREVTAIAKGFFVGPFGSSINDQPLAPIVLKKEHQQFATTARLLQPVAAYDRTPDKSKANLKPIIHWPPDLTVMYQKDFYDGYILNRAWQEVPRTAFTAMTDTIRNRVLRFALDLRDELGFVSDDPAALPQGKVDQSVSNYIFGGNNVISATAHDFTQIEKMKITVGDFDGLAASLRKSGVEDPEISELQEALDEDAKAGDGVPSLGQRTAAWLKGFGLKVAQAGTDVGVDTAKAAATRGILQYLGLS